ncbi:hypothetical protein IWZ01DRAFT_327802 [Phyllosticta capitalensis]
MVWNGIMRWLLFGVIPPLFPLVMIALFVLCNEEWTTHQMEWTVVSCRAKDPACSKVVHERMVGCGASSEPISYQKCSRPTEPASPPARGNCHHHNCRYPGCPYVLSVSSSLSPDCR